jgi:hypothetical protein
VSTILLGSALSLALLTTPPPKPGLHTTRSSIVLQWDYMKRWKQTQPASVKVCGGCHFVLVPNKRRDLRGITGIGYGTPVPVLPSAILFLSGVAAIASLNRRSK